MSSRMQSQIEKIGNQFPAEDSRPTIQAVIFDMDGVIADTELVDHRIQIDFVKKVNAERGRSSENLDFASLVGASHGMLDRMLWELTGRAWSPAETHERFETFDKEARKNLDYRTLFRQDTNKVLDFATSHGLATAVCSSSSLAHIEEVLSACGVLGRFDVIYSGELVPESKPHPQIYRNTVAALRRILGRHLEPAQCAAIEDSANGIAAARAAGIGLVIGYREERVPVDQSAADLLADDMLDVLRILTERLG